MIPHRAPAPRSTSGRPASFLSVRVYNGRMDQSTTRVRVTTSRARDHIENIHFRVGDNLAVGRRNLQYPEFVWCAADSGLAGWVFEKRLQMTGPGEAIATTDYDAAHLTVSAGESLTAREHVDSWLRCRNSRGLKGWVRVECVAEAPDE